MPHTGVSFLYIKCVGDATPVDLAAIGERTLPCRACKSSRKGGAWGRYSHAAFCASDVRTPWACKSGAMDPVRAGRLTEIAPIQR